MGARTPGRAELPRLPLVQVPIAALQDLALGQAREPRAADHHRELRAHPRPGPGRLLRPARLLLGAERLDAVGARVRRSGRGPRRDRLLPDARAEGRSRLPRVPVRAGGWAGRVRLRLELRLLPAGIPPAGAPDHDLQAARRSLPALRGRELAQGYPGCEMAVSTETDKAYLARAIELAGNGAGAVKPNPLVGAVVARDGEILGEGWHER